jgi:eukaryotic-like serine/threonine-protein kinase
METPIAAGSVLAGKYRVERVIGEGGMGVVIAAFHEGLKQKVALKFLHGAHARNHEVVARFLREGRAAAQIQSEHVGRVTDVGTLDNGAPYLVMEYLDGSDLSGLLRKSGTLSVDDAVDYVLQACEAIAEAHMVGIVHRDLKPANLFLTARRDGSPCVKVLDFGISKVSASAGDTEALTRTTGTMGSPLYMSPEQLRSARDVDARTDLWAIGVILFEILTGQQPFLADEVPQLTIKIVMEPPTPLRSLRPDVPPGLDSVIMRCLEKDPAGRYSNVGELALALAPFASRRSRLSIDRIVGVLQSAGIALHPPQAAKSALRQPQTGPDVRRGRTDPVGTLPVHIGAGTTAPTAATSPDFVEGHSPRSKRNKAFIAAGALVACLVMGTVAWIASRGARSTAEQGKASESAQQTVPSAPVLGTSETRPATSTDGLDAAPSATMTTAPPSAHPSSARPKPRPTQTAATPPRDDGFKKGEY